MALEKRPEIRNLDTAAREARDDVVSIWGKHPGPRPVANRYLPTRDCMTDRNPAVFFAVLDKKKWMVWRRVGNVLELDERMLMEDAVLRAC